jgi:hypothetical protein
MLQALPNCFLPCQARGPFKLSLVCFILPSNCDWSINYFFLFFIFLKQRGQEASINYLRGTFGVSQWPSSSWRALQMEKRNLSMSCLGRRGADALRGTSHYGHQFKRTLYKLFSGGQDRSPFQYTNCKLCISSKRKVYLLKENLDF